MIIDVKPPPPYTFGTNNTRAPPPFQQYRESPNLATLPPHILLQIVHSVTDWDIDSSQYRYALYWVAMSARRVSRSLYIACMHVLRSAYLPAYSYNVKAPYTSDPFPLSAPSPLPASSSPLLSMQRETAVFDLFIALKVKEDLRNDESELHIGTDSFKDIFELLQPRSRVEDLVRYYGLRQGVITMNPNPQPLSGEIYFGSVTVNWTRQKVQLALTTKGRKRTVVELRREKDETLENVAKRLVRDLRALNGGR